MRVIPCCRTLLKKRLRENALRGDRVRECGRVDIAQLVHEATGADTDVTLTQQVRGGISITAKASIPRTQET